MDVHVDSVLVPESVRKKAREITESYEEYGRERKKAQKAIWAAAVSSVAALYFAFVPGAPDILGPDSSEEYHCSVVAVIALIIWYDARRRAERLWRRVENLGRLAVDGWKFSSFPPFDYVAKSTDAPNSNRSLSK